MSRSLVLKLNIQYLSKPLRQSMEFPAILKKSYPRMNSFVPNPPYLEGLFIVMQDDLQKNTLTCIPGHQTVLSSLVTRMREPLQDRRCP